MFKTPVARLSIAMVLVSINLLFLANLIGLIPDPSALMLESRKVLNESLALQFCSAAEKGEFQTIQNTLRAVVERNDDIQSAAIRTIDGKLIALAGEHLLHWKNLEGGKSTPTHVQTPVYLKGKKWAQVELRFVPIWTNTISSGFTNSFIGLLAFVGLSSFICYFFLIKRTLRELDPSAVIPERVQNAFDVLKEGVMILDNNELIVMANNAFSKMFNRKTDAMVGLKGSELGWVGVRTPDEVRRLPWFNVLQEKVERNDALLNLLDGEGNKIKLAVNCSIVADNAGNCRGCLVTFDDITQLEEKNFELNNLVEKLQMSNQEIQTKSKELEFLASRDPLTLCLNRRSLERQFDLLFTKAKANKALISCLMVDIDFFKSVNDRYGHATGDRVIKGVAEKLRSCTRDSDLVGRYGGEEFCVVLPNLDVDKAMQIAERIRKTVEIEPCGGVKITVSLGVSVIKQNINKPEELVNLADKALYVAKKGGRNRVVSWGDSENLEIPSDSVQNTDTSKNLSKSENEKPGSGESPLERRVQELEAQLEKQKLELEHKEMFDPQTGFPTRALFEDRIAHEIARGKRKENLVAVLSMSIDTIKRVDETLGHRIAERLIQECGNRLHNVLRKDIDTVAVIENHERVASISQINQSEYGILLADIEQVDHITWVIKRLLDAFKRRFKIMGHEIYASVNIGVSIYPYDGQEVEELYNSAVNACNHVKNTTGEYRYLFASQDINMLAIKHLQVESCLHEAIDNNEMKLHFQPKIEVATGQVAGFEALLRWNSNRLGFVPPDEFIPIAEKSGQIDKIGDWVLYQACKQMRAWLDDSIEVASVAVNLSGLQLRQRKLCNRIQDILNQFNLETSMLEIELTESSLANTYDASFSILSQIKDMGIRVSMDDFGTGYSSLAYLRNIPLSCIKIDRSFIIDIGKDDNAEKLLSSIVSMAHGLGFSVVAEGVEEQQQADFLSSLGCEYLQGFLYSRPIPAAEAANFVCTRHSG